MATTFFERLKGYKTFIVNGIITITGLLQAFGIVDVIPSAAGVEAGVDNIVGGLSAVYGAINLALRYVTDSPIFNK